VLQCRGEAFVERGAVGQARKDIMMRHICNALLVLALVRHVFEKGQEMFRFARFVADCKPRRRQNEVVPVV
jgi:hypothetical protein